MINRNGSAKFCDGSLVGFSFKNIETVRWNISSVILLEEPAAAYISIGTGERDVDRSDESRY